jgi:hypothetical protein
MLAVPPLLLHAFDAVLHSPELAGNTSAAAGLASALTSLVKQAVKRMRAAVALEQERFKTAEAAAAEAAAAEAAAAEAAAAEAAAAEAAVAEAAIAEAAAAEQRHVYLDDACFPAAAMTVGGTHLANLSRSLCSALERHSMYDADSASYSSQAAASAALLLVVLARSVLELAVAMETVRPWLHYECLAHRPRAILKWRGWVDGQTNVLSMELSLEGSEEHDNASSQWQAWQVAVLKVVHPLLTSLRKLGMAPSAAAAAPLDGKGCTAARELISAGTAAAENNSSGGSASSATTQHSSSCGSAQEVKWGYLLRLQQCSPHWAAASAVFDAHWPYFEEWSADTEDGEYLEQQYYDAVALCMALADAAPITVVCNNPDCENMAGVSEAAASCKACSRCRCRYCSVECQNADWRRHKQACRQLAAAGCICTA